MAVSKRTRFEVFKRDAFTCQYCGQAPPKVILHADHILPSSKGGGDDQANLVTSCQDCNLGKSDRLLTDAPPALMGQIEERRERAEQLQAYNEFLIEIRAREDAAIKELGLQWHNLFNRKKDQWLFGPTRIPTIRQFLQQLPFTQIVDAIQIAHSRVPPDRKDDDRTFRYFCGICWRKIKES